MNRKFYDHRPIMAAHAHGLFELVWIVQHELAIEASFPCEVCAATGFVILKTKLESGAIVDRKEECYYCRGNKVRDDLHHDWTVLGPCQVYNYGVSSYPAEGKDKDYYFHSTYHLLAPEGYRKEGSYTREGELETVCVHGDEIFKTEQEALSDADRRNREAREKGKS